MAGRAADNARRKWSSRFRMTPRGPRGDESTRRDTRKSGRPLQPRLRVASRRVVSIRRRHRAHSHKATEPVLARHGTDGPAPSGERKEGPGNPIQSSPPRAISPRLEGSQTVGGGRKQASLFRHPIAAGVSTISAIASEAPRRRARASRCSLHLGTLEMVTGRPVNGELDAWFRSLMLSGSSGRGQSESGSAMPMLSGWKDLPMELLLRIISTVGDGRMVIVASGVCTGWRDALGWGVTNLSLSWCQQNMNYLMTSLAHKFTKLQVLTLRQNKPQLEDSAVEAVANYCHDLRELDLSRSFRLSDRSLYALAHGCPRLTRLNISGCSNFSDTALDYLTCHCKNLKRLNLCGCVKAATDRALQAIAHNCGQLQYLNLGWCEDVTDNGVISLASGCPDLRSLDLCGCIQITDESVVALATGCLHLRSLGLYFCQNITDRAMYSLANSRVKSKRGGWDTARSSSSKEEDGLANLNISQCTALTPSAVQAVCDSFPALHTCAERHSLIISGCLSLTSVHCACALHPHRAGRAMLPTNAY